jgi:hypothetical protein
MKPHTEPPVVGGGAPSMVALPKGRLAEQTLELFAAAGLPLPGSDNGRKLILESAAGTLRYIMAKPSDVPTFVEYGAADLGSAGSTPCARAGARSTSRCCCPLATAVSPWPLLRIARRARCGTKASRVSRPNTPT